MSHQFHRLSLAFSLMFALVALTVGYWNFVEGPSLLARADNPRRYLVERRVPRGSIYAQDGTPLAIATGPAGQLVREYPYPTLSPLIGYASPLFGIAGLEAAADGVLHGDAGRSLLEVYWTDDVLNAPPPGRAVTVTLDLAWQNIVETGLDEAQVEAGAVVVMEAATGKLRALASRPTYDANLLADQWETLTTDPRAPLLNRPTMALYQPGGALWPFILAEALQHNYGDLDATFPFATDPIIISGQPLPCHTVPPETALTLGEALQYGCAQPFTILGKRLGTSVLVRNFTALGFLEAPAITLPTVATPNTTFTESVALMAIGQGQLTLTPLHLAQATAALACGGVRPTPQFIAAVEAPDRQHIIPTLPTTTTQIYSSEVVSAVAPLLAQGYTANALAGKAGQTNTWFMGFAPAANPRYVIVILLEGGDAAKIEALGQMLLAQAEANVSAPGCRGEGGSGN